MDSESPTPSSLVAVVLFIALIALIGSGYFIIRHLCRLGNHHTLDQELGLD